KFGASPVVKDFFVCESSCPWGNPGAKGSDGGGGTECGRGCPDRVRRQAVAAYGRAATAASAARRLPGPDPLGLQDAARGGAVGGALRGGAQRHSGPRAGASLSPSRRGDRHAARRRVGRRPLRAAP